MESNKKNILLGYLYIFGGVFFIAVMCILIRTSTESLDSREYLELALVIGIGIACVYTGVKQIKDNKTLVSGIPKSIIEELRTQFELFKSLDISVRDITRHMSPHKEKYFLDNPIIVYSNDVTEALDKYKSGKVTDKDLLVWCHLMTFSNCFHFNPKRGDEIESVVIDIQKRLEKGEELSESDIDNYSIALIEETEI